MPYNLCHQLSQNQTIVLGFGIPVSYLFSHNILAKFCFQCFCLKKRSGCRQKKKKRKRREEEGGKKKRKREGEWKEGRKERRRDEKKKEEGRERKKEKKEFS